MPKNNNKSLHNYFDNLAKSSPTTPECERVLGSKLRVKELAEVWRNYAQEIQIIASVKLLEWTKSASYTPEILEGYKQGLAEIPAFFDACFKEVEKEKAQKVIDVG